MTTKQSIKDAVLKIGKEIAGPNAEDVDKNARFPIEAINALKKTKALSAGVPEELGGAGMDIIEQGNLCRVLSQFCASSSMILGMHFIKVSSIVYFAKDHKNFEDYLRDLVKEQRLVGSVTSEEGVGGNLRNSISAVEAHDDKFDLTKVSTCLSYGEYSDDLLITCRKNSDSPASEQVLVLARKGNFTVEKQGEWDSLGMRGTCSPPFIVKVKEQGSQIFKASFAEVAARTMVPDTHYIWANVWLGIAIDATRRARKLIQQKARKNPDQIPDAAKELAQLEIILERFKSTVKTIGDDYMRAHLADDENYLASIGFSLKINGLKLNASQMVADICVKAMAICGFAGYLNNSPYSVGRHLRDALSAAPMIGNGRIIEMNAANLMAYKGDNEVSI